MNKGTIRAVMIGLFVSFGLLACGEGREVTDRGKQALVDINQVVEWQREITLQENDSVINVTPRVSLDPSGGFIVADASESQFRVYGPEGELRISFGAKGGGPKEFSSPAAAIRLRDGGILAVDAGAPKAAVFDSAGGLVRTMRTPFSTVYDVDLLNDNAAIVAGTLPDEPFKRLHVWDFEADSILKSFLEAPVKEEFRAAAMAAGFASATVRNDSIAAVFAFSDTVYFFDTEAEPIGKLPVRSKYFRRLQSPPPRGGIDQVRSWMASFSMITDVFWGPRGSFLVQYQDRENMLPRWRLLRMTQGGELIFDLKDTPRLLAVGQERPALYFIKPGQEAPNLWAVGYLR